MSRALLAAAAGLLLLPATAGAQADCRAGTQEYSRQKIGNITHIYCVCSADFKKVTALDGRLAELDSQLAKDRAALENYQAEVPGYLDSLDEWVKLDEEARKQTAARARAAAITVVIQALRLAALQQNARMTPADAQAMWARLSSGPLGSPQFQQLLRQAAPGAILHPWHTASEALEGIEIIRQAIEGMHAGAAEEYGRAAIAALTVGVRDPKLAILLAEVDFAATAIVGNPIAWTARERVDQLLALGDKRLAAVASLSKTYRQHIDERKRLQQERVNLIARGSNPNTSCS